MFKYKNKTLPNCFKNYFTTPSETIIIRLGLLVMTTGLLHSNIKSRLQNVQFNIMGMKFELLAFRN